MLPEGTGTVEAPWAEGKGRRQVGEGFTWTDPSAQGQLERAVGYVDVAGPAELTLAG